MSENTVNTYEGMFLMPQTATGDLQGASDHVLGHLTKSGAELISFRKWDDRRLAYEIKGNKRGVFFLAYFKLAGTAVQGLERTLLLSEDIMRFLITRADHLSQEQMEAAEGRTELSDEIKLRAEQGGEQVGATVRATTRSERDAAEANGDGPPADEQTTKATEPVEETETTEPAETTQAEAEPAEESAAGPSA